MLNSKLHFFVSFSSLCLFISVLVIANQEAAYYVTGTETSITETWKSENWRFSGQSPDK